MVYNQNFVAVVKSSGKILREREQGVVQIPFGSEYSILLKNLHSKRALVSVSIDGQSIGNDLIMEPNTNFELERFLGDLNHGNKFKFIQKTKEIVDYRGDRVDDGMIRVEVRYEKDKPVVTDHYHHHHYDHWHDHWYDHWRSYPWYPTYTYTNAVSTLNSGGHSSSQGSILAVNSNVVSNTNSVCKEALDPCCQFKDLGPLPEEGITVKGSHSHQQFQYGSIGETEPNSIVIILRLQGYVGSTQVKVKEPVTVNDKITCDTCGKRNHSSHLYCTKCGTFLH